MMLFLVRRLISDRERRERDYKQRSCMDYAT